MVVKKTKRSVSKAAGRSKEKSSKEKLAGRIDHIFEKIQVVTITLKCPLKVGDVIRIKGATTDLLQQVDSIQIDHESVQKAKKGDGVGIKVKGYVRDSDSIFIAGKKAAADFLKTVSAPSVPAMPKQVVRPIIPAGPFASSPAAQGQATQRHISSIPQQIPPARQQEGPRFLSF